MVGSEDGLRFLRLAPALDGLRKNFAGPLREPAPIRSPAVGMPAPLPVPSAAGCACPTRWTRARFRSAYGSALLCRGQPLSNDRQPQLARLPCRPVRETINQAA
jgi:hypothetical protein